MAIAVPRIGGSELVANLPEIVFDGKEEFLIKPARVVDVHGMSALINQYAGANVMLARGPQYLYQHIQDYVVVTLPNRETGKETVIACGALHVLWEDLAEIRYIAVHRSCQRHGLGRKLVEKLVERGAFLGIPRIFVFTLAPEFFSRCGFAACDRDILPPFVWVECSKCPKFYRCDEIGMIRNLQ